MRPVRAAFPGVVERAGGSVAERRGKWRALVEIARVMCRRALDTDGRETVEPLDPHDFSHRLAKDGAARFPIEDASGQAVAISFLALARVMRGLQDNPDRRALIAGPLLACADAADTLMTQQAQAEAEASWKRYEPGED